MLRGKIPTDEQKLSKIFFEGKHEYSNMCLNRGFASVAAFFLLNHPPVCGFIVIFKGPLCL